MPDPLELPRVLRAVVPLVRGERAAGFGRGVVDELVALGLGHALRRGVRLLGGRPGLMPGLAPVVRPLDDLTEPAAGLRAVDAVRIDRRALEVVDLPASEERAAGGPLLPPGIGGEDKGPLAGADENANAGHALGSFW